MSNDTQESESASPYRDKRSEFFRSYFEQGFDYAAYLCAAESKHRSRWWEFASKVSLTPEQRVRIGLFRRKLSIIVMSGIWCGDCARQGPMLRAIEEASPLITCRYLDNRENPELQEELRINGAEKVPVVVALSEDFFELARFGDRHLTVYRRKVRTELGAACDPGIVAPPETELAAELEEWVGWFERLEHMLRLAPALRKRYKD